MAKKEGEPEIKKEYEKIVDEMIMVELENRWILKGVKKKKGKKKKKKGKKKKRKGKPLPGEKSLAKYHDVRDILYELV